MLLNSLQTLENTGFIAGELSLIVSLVLYLSLIHILGFGDYLNDMSLLESCGESYCMKNGHPTLKALAKYVTEKTNDENGVMEVLKTL